MHTFLAELAAAGLYTPPEHQSRPVFNGQPLAAPPPVTERTQRYAWAALQGEVDTVAGTPEGRRNHELNRAAFRMGQLCGLGYLTPGVAAEHLTVAGQACGLGEKEIAATVRSGLAAGHANTASRRIQLRPEAAPEAYVMEGDDPVSAVSADVHGMSTPPLTSVNGGPATLADRLLDRDQLADLPPPRPLIAGTLDLNTVAVLAGYWGTCKSFLAQDWAASVATGRRWQGRPTVQRRALYVAAEGAYGLHQRLRAWEVGWRTTIEPDDLHVLPVPVNLGQLGSVAELCALVSEGQYGFVVIDTLAKCMYGLDENSAQDMGRAVFNLYRLREATGDGTVLAVHHTGKDRSTVRGSSALEGGVDVVYTTEGGVESITVVRTKRKDGPTHDQHTLTLSVVEGTDSAVLNVHGGADISRSSFQLLSTFMSAFSETGASRVDLRHAAEMPPASFARALNDLVKQGRLVNTGSEKRPFYRQPSNLTLSACPPVSTPPRTCPSGVSAYRADTGHPDPDSGDSDRDTERERNDSIRSCDRCHREAERLVPGTRGERWCPRCAYPTDPGVHDQEEE